MPRQPDLFTVMLKVLLLVIIVYVFVEACLLPVLHKIVGSVPGLKF